MKAAIDLTNCYTDYGFWPFAVFLPVAALALYFNRRVAGILLRLTGPVGARPDSSLTRLHRSRGWQRLARLQVVLFAGGFLAGGILAVLGLLPCE